MPDESTKAITIKNHDELVRMGQLANQIVSANVFANYRKRKAKKTIKRQNNDLVLFGQFLAGFRKVPSGDMANDPGTWEEITSGQVELFAEWCLETGYAVGSINVMLATVRTYADLAAKAGVLDHGELTMILRVRGYSHREGINVDEQRDDAGIETRRSLRRDDVIASRKISPTWLTSAQIALLKAQPNNPRGRRDRLLICLLLNHGLRCSEVSGLTVESFDLDAGTLTFYRPKTDIWQTLALLPDFEKTFPDFKETFEAAREYLEQDAPTSGPLWRWSRKGKTGYLLIDHQGMTTRGINKRVGELGDLIGISNLSPHDLRHIWATRRARQVSFDQFKEEGGWKSVAMPMRYVKAGRVIGRDDP